MVSSFAVGLRAFPSLLCLLALTVSLLASSARADEGTPFGAVPSPLDVARLELARIQQREQVVRRSRPPCMSCGIVGISIGTPLTILLTMGSALFFQSANDGYELPKGERQLAGLMLTGAVIGAAGAGLGAWQVARARRARRAKASELSELSEQHMRYERMLAPPPETCAVGSLRAGE